MKRKQAAAAALAADQAAEQAKADLESPPEAVHPPAPEDLPPAPPVEETPDVSTKAEARSVNALSVKVTMISERLKAQEAATGKITATLERMDGVLSELTKRTQPMLETLSAELARQGAMLESLKTESEANLDVQTQRVTEFEQRLAGVLREMREVVAAKVESGEIQMKDRMEEARASFAEQMSAFEDRVNELVRRFAADAIPDEMKEKVEDLSGRFVHAETALAATRSSVEFLRAEVGSLTMLIRKLGPGEAP